MHDAGRRVWGWKTNAAIKPLRDCILLLVKAAGRDGNFILNVGPRPDGQIDPPQAQRLKQIGDWLGKFGESIYGTRGGPFLPAAYGVSTHRDKRIYVHVLNWPQGGKLALPAMPAKILRASLLGGGTVTFSQSGQLVEISVPVAGQDGLDTIVVLELEQSANGLKPIPVGRDAWICWICLEKRPFSNMPEMNPSSSIPMKHQSSGPQVASLSRRHWKRANAGFYAKLEFARDEKGLTVTLSGNGTSVFATALKIIPKI